MAGGVFRSERKRPRLAVQVRRSWDSTVLVLTVKEQRIGV